MLNQIIREVLPLHKTVERAANTFIFSLLGTLLVWSCSIWLTPLDAAASSENGLIFYVEAGRFQAEADQKYKVQWIGNKENGKQKPEDQSSQTQSTKISNLEEQE